MTDWERFEQMQPEEEQTDSAPGTFTHEPGESPSQPDVSPNAKLEKMSATGGEDAFPVSAPAESTDAQQEKTEQADKAWSMAAGGDSCNESKSTDGLVLGIAIGMVAGILIGFLLKQMPIWIVGGILLGGAIGFLLDLRSDRRRKESAACEKDAEQ